MEKDPAKLHHRLLKVGTEAARARARHSTLERLRKQIRASEMVKYINLGNTVGKSEQLALLEPEYVEICEKCEAAEEEAGVAQVEYQAAQAYIEVWRTLEATKRAEMRL